jgi:hypothetical protein
MCNTMLVNVRKYSSAYKSAGPRNSMLTPICTHRDCERSGTWQERQYVASRADGYSQHGRFQRVFLGGGWSLAMVSG